MGWEMSSIHGFAAITEPNEGRCGSGGPEHWGCSDVRRKARVGIDPNRVSFAGSGYHHMCYSLKTTETSIPTRYERKPPED